MIRFSAPLRRFTVAAVALGMTGLIACSSGGGSTSPAAPATTVRVGILGGAGDSLDVTKASSFISYGVALNLFDSLVVMSQGESRLQLAESITSRAWPW